MITEDYVSFEVAKLLKEKGFYQDFLNNITPIWKLNGTNEELAFYGEDNYPCEWEEWYFAPTLQMTMKWLREIHNIFVVPKMSKYTFLWGYRVFISNGSTVCLHDNIFNKYEQACEAAIKYCLENLI